MSHEFFPISLEVLGANINYMDLKEGELDLGDIHVTTQYINHNVLTLGYRLEAEDGTSMAYITDHEPYNHKLATEGYMAPVEGSPLSPDDRHAEFFRGVDLLVHDTQYTIRDYLEHYGHSTVEYVVDMAMAVGVKKLALFHHDPNRTDDQQDEILVMAKERVRAAGGTLQVIAAADNTSHELEGDPELATRTIKSLTKPKVLKDKPSLSALATNEFVAADQEIVITYKEKKKFTELASDGLCISYIEKGHPFLRTVNEKKPSCVLVSYESPEDEYVFKNCQRLRESSGEWGEEVPYIVIVKDQELLEKVKERHGEASRVTDFICEPFSEAYIRTRVRMVLARNPCKWVPPIKPSNEGGRMAALRSLQILDSTPEERFDRITRMCATVFDVPLVFISLVDENRQWFKSAQWLCSGSAPSETSREVSFCGHAILGLDIFLIPDATQDERFADNPLVVDGPKIRFYAGCPLSIANVNDPNGSEYNIGTLCIIDQRPRDLDEVQKTSLREFGAMVKTELLNFAKDMTDSASKAKFKSVKSLEISQLSSSVNGREVPKRPT